MHTKNNNKPAGKDGGIRKIRVQTLSDFDVRIMNNGSEKLIPFDYYESARQRFEKLAVELDYLIDDDYAYSSENDDSWLEIVKNFKQGGEVAEKMTFNAPRGMVFVKVGSHRASEKIERSHKIPYSSMYNLYWGHSAGTSMLLIHEKDYQKIKDIKGVGTPKTKLVSEGEWFVRKSERESEAIANAYRAENEKQYLADGGEITVTAPYQIPYSEFITHTKGVIDLTKSREEFAKEMAQNYAKQFKKRVTPRVIEYFQTDAGAYHRVRDLIEDLKITNFNEAVSEFKRLYPLASSDWRSALKTGLLVTAGHKEGNYSNGAYIFNDELAERIREAGINNMKPIIEEITGGIYAEGGSITKTQKAEFVEYINGFYGKGGIYAHQFTNNGFPKQQLEIATDKYLKSLGTNEFYGDTFDREKVRTILEKYDATLYADGGDLSKKYKKGDFVFGKIYKDENKKVPFIVSYWSHDRYYVLGDGSHYIKPENLLPATEKDFDDYYGESGKSFKNELKYADGGNITKVPAGVKYAARFAVEQAHKKNKYALPELTKVSEGSIPNKKIALYELNEFVNTARNDMSLAIQIAYDDKAKIRTWLEKLPDEFNVPDNYYGKTPKQIWDAWTYNQKSHFLGDHHEQLCQNAHGHEHSTGKNTYTTPESYIDKPFNELPDYVKDTIIDHCSSTQYKQGGKVKKDRWVVFYVSKETGGMRERYFDDEQDAWVFAKSVNSEPAKFEQGGSIDSDRNFKEADFNKLTLDTNFTVRWSGNTWEIGHSSTSKTLGSFTPRLNKLYIRKQKDLTNPLVDWLKNNSYVSDEEYTKLSDGGNVWTPEQSEKVKQLDSEFEIAVENTGINRNSKEAADLWRSGGFQNRMKAIFDKQNKQGGDILKSEFETEFSNFKNYFPQYYIDMGHKHSGEEEARGISFLNQIHKASQTDNEAMANMHKWLKQGSTLLLRDDILKKYTDYNRNAFTENTPSALLDFNAFSGLDSAGLHYREGKKFKDGGEIEGKFYIKLDGDSKKWYDKSRVEEIPGVYFAMGRIENGEVWSSPGDVLVHYDNALRTLYNKDGSEVKPKPEYAGKEGREINFEDGGKVDSDANLNGLIPVEAIAQKLIGKTVVLYFLGDQEGHWEKITNAVVTPKQFLQREMTLTFKDGAQEKFPLNKLRRFLNLDEIKTGPETVLRLSDFLEGVYKPLRSVKVTLKNGDVINTNVSATSTDAEIRDYYKHAEKVEILPDEKHPEGYFAEGGNISSYDVITNPPKIGDKVSLSNKEGSITHSIKGIVYEVSPSGKTFRLKDDYGNKSEKWHNIIDFKKAKITRRFENVNSDEDAIRLKYAKKDVAKLEKEGYMAIVDTKHGVLWLEYENGVYSGNDNAGNDYFRGNKQTAIDFIKNAYTVEFADGGEIENHEKTFTFKQHTNVVAFFDGKEEKDFFKKGEGIIGTVVKQDGDILVIKSKNGGEYYVDKDSVTEDKKVPNDGIIAKATMDTKDGPIIGKVIYNEFWKKYQVYIDGSLYGEYNTPEPAIDELDRSGFKNIKKFSLGGVILGAALGAGALFAGQKYLSKPNNTVKTHTEVTNATEEKTVAQKKWAERFENMYKNAVKDWKKYPSKIAFWDDVKGAKKSGKWTSVLMPKEFRHHEKFLNNKWERITREEWDNLFMLGYDSIKKKEGKRRVFSKREKPITIEQYENQEYKTGGEIDNHPDYVLYHHIVFTVSGEDLPEEIGGDNLDITDIENKGDGKYDAIVKSYWTGFEESDGKLLSGSKLYDKLFDYLSDVISDSRDAKLETLLILSKLEKGGKIGFEGLEKKVAKKYVGKKVPKKYQKEYGKTYDKKEALIVGAKVANKVKKQQALKAKMAKKK